MKQLKIVDFNLLGRFDESGVIGKFINSSKSVFLSESGTLLFEFEAFLLLLICSFGDVRTLKENSAYSTSFSPEIVSSPNSLSSSELSLVLVGKFFDAAALFWISSS